MDDKEVKYSYNQLVCTIERLEYMVNLKYGAVFHSVIEHDPKELEKLCGTHKDVLKIYTVDGEKIYYFQYGVPEFYEDIPNGFKMSRLKQDTLDMIYPPLPTGETGAEIIARVTVKFFEGK